ncbi:molybdopterin converting factor subunit 1 [Thermoplasma volcanium GSS1]|uniref:Molybdopterin converting factor subunit 1 n=1 Tax=Thermoplasma volcanium (strain ATCC 51530 / DSM 4299 / JCM 9571 / NBRC 15438 / GSS1) TaxID=273116 RepID=Q97B89_THEVO|nr:MoaD/ThiS family protein [Thermoplasma volcanium]BAB59710.1 molybdopterin converting factor subunit 1 [Thermoplasma volcanium GSS1]
MGIIQGDVLDLKVRVRYFAYFKEKVGKDEEYFELSPGSNVGTLINEVMKKYKNIFNPKDTLIAVNYKYVDQNYNIAEGDTVAIMPHVSGG